MEATVLYGARDVRLEDRPEPTIIEPTDAVIRLPFTCICGSDLWPYRGIQPVSSPTAMGHEYCGFVEEVGRDVTSVKPGQFVIGSFFASDNTCPHCRHGYQTSCQRFEPVVGAQAPHMRVPLADGTLVATRDVPDTDMMPSLLALSDVMGTGHHAAAKSTKAGLDSMSSLNFSRPCSRPRSPRTWRHRASRRALETRGSCLLRSPCDISWRRTRPSIPRSSLSRSSRQK